MTTSTDPEALAATTEQPPSADHVTSPDPNRWPELESMWQAWEEICFGAPATDLQAEVAAIDDPASQTPASADQDSPVTGPTRVWAPVEPAGSAPSPVARVAAAVETATAAADAHTADLKDHPEWQRIQTLRGALHHVWDVMKENAGPYWENLRADVRFQGFWKTASIRVCEAISVQAAALANRLSTGGDLPTADSLIKLSDATLTYSTAAAAEPVAAPPASPTEPNAAKAPDPQGPSRVPVYATRDEAARAGAEVTAYFRAWMASPMGQQLAGSDHRRVVAFRDAWRRLPPPESGPGPAAGPYGEVAEHAKALLAAGVATARFAPSDLRSLQTLAQAADNHAARLAVTLPPRPARLSRQAAAPTPRVATPTAPSARTPRASA